MVSTMPVGGGHVSCIRRSSHGIVPSHRVCLVKCKARSSESGSCQPVSAVKAVVLPGLLAAALLHSSVAHAGVVLKKPESKKVFQGQSASKKAESTESSSGSSGPGFQFPSFSAPSLPSFKAPSLPSVKGPDVKAPSLPSVKGPEIELDGRFLALPASIGFVGVLAFLASQVDPKFGEFMNESLVKDSTSYTGYEEDPAQGRGSPQGFLGLGNLYPDAGPGAKFVASKAKQVAGSQPSSPFKGKGSGLPKLPGSKGGTKRVQKPGQKKRGLFK